MLTYGKLGYYTGTSAVSYSGTITGYSNTLVCCYLLLQNVELTFAKVQPFSTAALVSVVFNSSATPQITNLFASIQTLRE